MDLIHVYGGIMVILIGCWYHYREKPSYHKQCRKTIWTYWENPLRIPQSMERAIYTWKRWNPTHEVVILTKKNYLGYTVIPDAIYRHPKIQSDPKRFQEMIMIWTLAEHGGVWIDPFTTLHAPLESWMFTRFAEGSGFFDPWIRFFAWNKGSKEVRKWRDEWMRRFNTDETDLLLHTVSVMDLSKIIVRDKKKEEENIRFL